MMALDASNGEETMPYAIRYNSPNDSGMLVELSTLALRRIHAKQEREDSARDDYWEAEENARGEEPPVTYPYYDAVSAHRAHNWVRNGFIHETLLFTDGDKIRRAR
jgi:hypothetical protein